MWKDGVFFSFFLVGCYRFPLRSILRLLSRMGRVTLWAYDSTDSRDPAASHSLKGVVRNKTVNRTIGERDESKQDVTICFLLFSRGPAKGASEEKEEEKERVVVRDAAVDNNAE